MKNSTYKLKISNSYLIFVVAKSS